MSEGERLAERSLAISRELGDREAIAQALQVQGVWASFAARTRALATC